MSHPNIAPSDTLAIVLTFSLIDRFIQISSTTLKGDCWGDHMEQETQINFLQVSHRLRVTKFLRWYRFCYSNC
jgi:hypothetical protein